MGAGAAIVVVFVIGLLIFAAVVPIVTCPCCHNNPILKIVCPCCGGAGKITIFQYIQLYIQYAGESLLVLEDDDSWGPVPRKGEGTLGIPGFPLEAIALGILLALATLILMRGKRIKLKI